MFKCRASSVGTMMTNPRSKKEKEAGVLSKTVQTLCQEWVIENKYNRRKDTDNKYTRKGNQVEDDSIATYILESKLKNKDGSVVSKNQKSFTEDKYITGTPDIISDMLVVDIKSPYDVFTFPFFEIEVPDKKYYWQLQAYMYLTGLKEAELAYVLSNHTNDELYSLAYKEHYKDPSVSMEDCEEKITERYTFDDIPREDRVKVFKVKRNDEDIKKMIERVKQCQKYVKSELKFKK